MGSSRARHACVAQSLRGQLRPQIGMPWPEHLERVLLRDPAAEFALLRTSTNACRVMHVLRAVGSELPLEDTLAFDEVLEGSFGTILGGLVYGLAVEIQLFAFISSRTESRALARHLGANLPAAASAALFAHWDAQVADALQK